MRNLSGVRVIVSLLITLLFPYAALAQGQVLNEGEHYLSVKCRSVNLGNDKKQCIKLINERGYDIDAQSLAGRFGIDSFQLRAQNPRSTIAVCRDPIRRSIWHMARIQRIADRESNIIWASCPEKDRRVVTIPGETYQIDSQSGLPSFTSIENAVRAASQCGAKDPACVRKAIESVVPTGMEGEIPPVPPAQNPNPPAALPPSPEQNPAANQKNVMAETAQSSNSASSVTDSSEDDNSIYGFGVLFSLFVAACVMVGILLSGRGRTRQRIVELEDELEGERSRSLQLRNSHRVLREKNLTDLAQQKEAIDQEHSAVLEEREKLHQQTLLEKQKEVDQKNLRIQTMEKFISQLYSRFSGDDVINELSVPAFVRLVEREIVSDIIQHTIAIYGLESISPMETPKTRDQAWAMLREADQVWHRQYLEKIANLQLLITSNPSSFRKDPTGFAALDQMNGDVLFCRKVIRDELERVGVASEQTDDLMTLFGSYVSAFVHTENDLRETRRVAEVYQRAQVEALKSARSGNEPSKSRSSEPEEIPKPDDTLPGGLSRPFEEERRSSPRNFRLVSSQGT